jgi:protein-disulfide isomerase
MRNKRSRWAAAAALLILAACSSSAQQATQMSPNEVVATVGSSPITLAEVDEKALQSPASNFGGARLVQALYLSRRDALDEIVGQRLMDAEAKKRGIDRSTLVEQEIANKAPAPTAADIEFWYQNNAARVQGATLDQVRDAIKALLIEERMGRAKSALLAALKDKTPVTVSLEPPRLKIAVDGHASKGDKDAPIQLVEFSDFECPFCARVNPTLAKLQEAYPGKVRIVFRDLPLLNIHKNAGHAAEAAHCANDQGKFWEMHDRMFANQKKLSPAELKEHAAAIGLEASAFNQCLDSGKYTAEWRRDADEASRLGLSGTPAFFINGRLLTGAQPFENFAQIVEEELAAAGEKRPTAGS